jgi:sterol desaturase/sphingolipid hydroxylase (fatty acid hydroxylase superfamily)
VGEIAIPYVFAALIVIELLYNAIRATGFQDVRDSAVSVLVAVPHFALLTIIPVLWFVAYRWVEPRIPGALPADAWWIWPLGIVVMDFAAYWMHRYHHALNLTWGVHSVHHSSEHLTIATGGRSSMAEPVVNLVSGAYLILIAPALLGLPAAAAGLGWLVKDTWGFAVHTRNVDTLGPLEYLLATPSHHRVHHATNDVYLGKNFGFVFILWDKLFGTFQPERRDIAAIYGTVRPPRTYQPVAVAFHELACVWRDAVSATRWRDKLRIWFMPAGWRPDGAASVPATLPRSMPAVPARLYLVGGLELGFVFGCIAHLTFSVGMHGRVNDLGYLGFIVLGSAIVGAFFDGSRRYAHLACARALVILLSVVLGTWFGRPLDLGVWGLVALAIACLGASLGHARADATAGRRDARRDAAGVRGDVVRVLPGREGLDRSDARG